MVIFNNSDTPITVGENQIMPNTWAYYLERVFDTINIHSDYGSAVLTCEYKDVHIKNFGIMFVCEMINTLESGGHKCFFVSKEGIGTDESKIEQNADKNAVGWQSVRG